MRTSLKSGFRIFFFRSPKCSPRPIPLVIWIRIKMRFRGIPPYLGNFVDSFAKFWIKFGPGEPCWAEFGLKKRSSVHISWYEGHITYIAVCLGETSRQLKRNSQDEHLIRVRTFSRNSKLNIIILSDVIKALKKRNKLAKHATIFRCWRWYSEWKPERLWELGQLSICVEPSESQP